MHLAHTQHGRRRGGGSSYHPSTERHTTPTHTYKPPSHKPNTAAPLPAHHTQDPTHYTPHPARHTPHPAQGHHSRPAPPCRNRQGGECCALPRGLARHTGPRGVPLPPPLPAHTCRLVKPTKRSLSGSVGWMNTARSEAGGTKAPARAHTHTHTHTLHARRQTTATAHTDKPTHSAPTASTATEHTDKPAHSASTTTTATQHARRLALNRA